MVNKSGAAGLNLDLEALSAKDKDNLSELASSLSQQLHQSGKYLSIDITANDPAYDPEFLGNVADYIVLMAYDEHYPSSEPGPIASRDWYNDIVDRTSQEITASKLIVSLGAYGYDWINGSKEPANSLKFSEIMSLAQDSGAQPELTADYGYNNYFGYQDSQKQSHQVWFLNGVTAYNEWLTVKNDGLAGVALWHLGSEDATYWRIFNTDVSAQSFVNLPPLTSVNYDSEGELFVLESTSQGGRLEITTDTDGSIDYALYDQLPAGYDLTAVGQSWPAKSLALTFDDGPDETWTPQILAVLKKYQVPAAFFMVGEQAQQNPEIVSEIAQNKNFLIGNHTYLHPDITAISRGRLQLELNETQRVIEAEAGRKTVMFRPPYDTDSTPSDPAQLASLSVVKDSGYIIAGANIDAEDWQRPGVPAIINNVLTGLKNSDNHVIVMHDAGGNRAQTVAALNQLIPLLKSQGYNFVSLNQGIGLSASALNPPLSQKEMVLVIATRIWSSLTRWGWLIIVWLFLLTTIIAIFRILFLGVMVLRSEKHYRRRNGAAVCQDPVSILVPAYNEEKTIAQTLSALQKNYKNNFEVLVINDGSTDNTAAVVEKFAATDPRIRLVSKPNGGKSSALNLGFQEAKYDLVVTIDGDTILLPDTLDELTKPFIDPQVDAVCGNVEVGNVRNILTGFQTLEYITTQNFDRRAFDELNCISVVPGATGLSLRRL
jgi:peptidoglycan/xylan/chitin deacetylase (PgdA/CDA1 family)